MEDTLVSAADTLAAARAAGVRVGADGMGLLIEANREPPRHLLDALRRHKPEILDLLTSACRDCLHFTESPSYPEHGAGSCGQWPGLAPSPGIPACLRFTAPR